MPSGHVVVDGSNIATEGRSEPSLAQLEEALAAFTADHDFDRVTVVVDASFEHRVAKRERAAVRRAIEEGRIITPPAGVVGRGDTFILEIAERAGAVVLSNDSFQEFHGEYGWLFEEGRLIGGKPVEHIGWVFVPRRPVRGATSREALRKAQSPAAETKKSAAKRSAEKAPTKRSAAEKAAAKKAAAKKPAAKKTPTREAPTREAPTREAPTREAPTREAPTEKPAAKKAAAKKGTAKKGTAKKPAARKARTKKTPPGRTPTEKTPPEKPAAKKSAAKKARRQRAEQEREKASEKESYNPVRAWRRFRGKHPVGSSVEARVERFSSHGAHAVTDGGLAAYVPSKLLADPPPKRARDVLAEGSSVSFVVHEYEEDTRGIVLGLVGVEATKPKSSAR